MVEMTLKVRRRLMVRSQSCSEVGGLLPHGEAVVTTMSLRLPDAPVALAEHHAAVTP